MRALETKAQTWRQRLADWRASGQSIAVWCGNNGCCRQTFYRWQARLSPPDAGTVPMGSGLAPLGAFAEVLVASPGPRSVAAEPLRLRLIGGRELILPASMPAQSLAQLIHAIENPPAVKGLPWALEACPELVEGGQS
jgi:hypothetical protein